MSSTLDPLMHTDSWKFSNSVFTNPITYRIIWIIGSQQMFGKAFYLPAYARSSIFIMLDSELIYFGMLLLDEKKKFLGGISSS